MKGTDWVINILHCTDYNPWESVDWQFLHGSLTYQFTMHGFGQRLHAGSAVLQLELWRQVVWNYLLIYNVSPYPAVHQQPAHHPVKSFMNSGLTDWWLCFSHKGWQEKTLNLMSIAKAAFIYNVKLLGGLSHVFVDGIS